MKININWSYETDFCLFVKEQMILIESNTSDLRFKHEYTFRPIKIKSLPVGIPKDLEPLPKPLITVPDVKYGSSLHVDMMRLESFVKK